MSPSPILENVMEVLKSRISMAWPVFTDHFKREMKTFGEDTDHGKNHELRPILGNVMKVLKKSRLYRMAGLH